MERIIGWLEDISLAMANLCVASIMFAVSFDAISAEPAAAPGIRRGQALHPDRNRLSDGLGHLPQGEHVQIEMLRDRISVRLRDWLETTWSLMAATVFALMARGACLAGPEQRNQQVLADAGQTAQQHLCAFLDGMPVQDEWATTLDGTGRPDTEVLEAYRPASSEF